MEVTIKEFYPLTWNKKLDKLTGNLRICVNNYNIEILGIYVIKKKGSYFFSLPGLKRFCPSKQKQVHFPFISFTKKGEVKKIYDHLKIHAPIFIEKRLKDKENPLIWP